MGASAALLLDGTGGSLSSTGGGITVTVPPGALGGPTEVTLVEITSTAPGAVGTAYRIGPEGLVLLAPVTLTFAAPEGLATADLTVSTQLGGTGAAFWLRVPGVIRDEDARTVSVEVEHLSDWALTTTTTALDLSGPIHVTSTLDGIAFSASGWATLNHAGGSGDETWYVTGGALTLAEPVAYAGGACTAASPVWALHSNVATLDAGASRLELGFSGYWDLACTGGSASSAVAAFGFDTIGVAHHACARSWVGTPTIGPDAVAGTFQVDCGARGWLEATWDLAAP